MKPVTVPTFTHSSLSWASTSLTLPATRRPPKSFLPTSMMDTRSRLKWCNTQSSSSLVLAPLVLSRSPADGDSLVCTHSCPRCFDTRGTKPRPSRSSSRASSPRPRRTFSAPTKERSHWEDLGLDDDHCAYAAVLYRNNVAPEQVLLDAGLDCCFPCHILYFSSVLVWRANSPFFFSLPDGLAICWRS